MTGSPIRSITETILFRMLEASDAGICALDGEGQCTFINSTGAGTFGYRPDELIGQSWHALMHVSDERTPAPSECPSCFAAQSIESCRGLKAMYRHRDGR